MANVLYNLSDYPKPISRKVLPLVKVISSLYPDIEVTARSSTYESLVFSNPQNENLISKQDLLQAQVELTKASWLNILFTEANMIQEYASSYFSFSNRGYNQAQLSVYDQKHAKAKSYLYEINLYAGTLEEAKQNVAPPPMLANEANLTGDDPYELAQSIVLNYISSNDFLTAYFGSLEGERRLAKQRILSCTTLTQLQNVKWADWPEFIPPSLNIGD
jgi:hypothetical protein